VTYPTEAQIQHWRAELMEMSGAEKLRAAVRLCNNMSEGFNDCYTVEQLLRLWEGYRLCGWDFAPDAWEDFQVTAWLLGGELPRWDEDEQPIGPRGPSDGGAL
jgi:hypothetical protein